MINHSKPTIDQDDLKIVSEVLHSVQLAQGPMVETFEKNMCKYIGMKGGVATNSGTSALHLALLALNIGNGDEVIIPSYVCTALLNAVSYVGAKPVMVDVKLDDFNISLSDIKRKLNEKTKVIIVPHMFGLPADIDEIVHLGIPVIEDCAQSIGALYNGNKVGSFGVISIFSFYATKMLATGEGGMALSQSNELVEKMRDLRDYDFKTDYLIRYNYKMTEIQAALGSSQLTKLPDFIKRRKQIADCYNKEFSHLDVTLPHSEEHKEHIFYRYIVRAKKNINPNVYFDEFKKKKIICSPPIFKPLHLYLGLNRNDFVNTEKIMKSAISIPIYPSLSLDDVKEIITVVKEVLK